MTGVFARTFWMVSATLVACSEPCLVEDPAGPRVRLDDPADGLSDLVAHPWPSNALRRKSGSLILDHFPNPTESSTLDDYLDVISKETRAYGTSSPIYLGFSEAIDPATLPAGPMEATASDSTVALIDIDPASPERGRRYPLETTYRDPATLFLAEHNLTVMSPYGIPLSGATTYAVIVTDGVRTTGGEPVKASRALHSALREGCRDSISPSLFSAFAPLRELLSQGELDREAVAGATVFTTQDAVGEMRRLVEAARAEPVPLVEDLERIGGDGFIARYRGVIELPSFQSGERPYRSLGDGGALRRDAQGRFLLDHTETTRVGIALPMRGSMPSEGWPVVVFPDGTGSDYESAFQRNVAAELSVHGIATVSYDPTLHGPRDPTRSDPTLTFFNLFNPVAARDNIRQGAADLSTVISVLETLTIPDSITGRPDARFDRSRVVVVGHSQGALSAALSAVAEPRPRATVFSGLGAILAITILERKDIVDLKALLETLIGFPEEERLDETHPVMGIVQTFIEPADPIAYAKSYLGDPPGGVARDVLQIEGFLDFASPARGQEAFAAAARIPLVAPAHRVPAAAVLVGPPPVTGPASANVMSAAGPVTFGLIQYPEETHFPMFESADANRRFVEMVRSVMFDGRGVILASP